MLSSEFESWYHAFFRNDPNHNGIYNGMNLAGLDIARLYLGLHKNPSLTIPEFLGREETFYKVTVPKARRFELPKLYSWMLTTGSRNEKISWEIWLAQISVPVRIESNNHSVATSDIKYGQ